MLEIRKSAGSFDESDLMELERIGLRHLMPPDTEGKKPANKDNM